MTKTRKNKTIFVTIFVLALLCVSGVVAFNHKIKLEKEIAEPKQLTLKQPEQRESLSVKEAQYEITQRWGQITQIFIMKMKQR